MFTASQAPPVKEIMLHFFLSVWLNLYGLEDSVEK